MPSHHLEVLETWLCRVGNAFNPVLRSITTYYHVQPRSGHETAMSGACCLPHFFAAGAKKITISTCVGTPTAKTQSRRPPMHSLAGRSSSSGPPLVRRGASHCHQGRPGESRGPGPVVLAVGRVHTLYMRGQLSATALAAVVGCKRRVRARIIWVRQPQRQSEADPAVVTRR